MTRTDFYYVSTPGGHYGEMKKTWALLLVLSMIICMFTACGQSAQPAEEGKYTIENIRDQVVGLNEQMELENGKKTVVTNFDNAATTPALQPVMDEVNEKLNTYGSIGRGFSPKSDYSTDPRKFRNL